MDDNILTMLGGLVAQQQPPQDISTDLQRSIVECSLQHGLGPMLYWSLKQHSYDVQSPELLPLVQATHRAAMKYALHEKARSEINAALHDAEIPALWLKGAVLAETIYPEPTLRPMSDLDVLVPYEQRERALEVVQGLGYDFYTRNALKPRRTDDELIAKLSHHYHLKGGTTNSVVLELHFRLVTYRDEMFSLEQLQWFWAQQQTLHLDEGAALITLTPDAHLIYLCAHALLQHGEANLYLLRLFDLHQIITQTALNWDMIVEQTVTLGWTSAVGRALQLSMVYFTTPIPDGLLDLLVNRRPAHEDNSRVTRLTGAGNRWERTRANLDAMSLREKSAYLYLLAVPTRSYMRQRYNIRPGWPTWPYYLYRWFDQSLDILQSTWKRLSRQYED
ncbi:MAG: nucleotidyltransferase family protein [Chloroflexi bacterium]|nr:nucleotidyltransferase family protein [Chloroflexota bacterium]